MNYVHGWLAHNFDMHFKTPVQVRGPIMVNFSREGEVKYFDDFDAHDIIHRSRYISWHASIWSRSWNDVLKDNEKLSFWNHYSFQVLDHVSYHHGVQFQWSLKLIVIVELVENLDSIKTYRMIWAKRLHQPASIINCVIGWFVFEICPRPKYIFLHVRQIHITRSLHVIKTGG